jgi:hypothetical protein
LLVTARRIKTEREGIARCGSTTALKQKYKLLDSQALHGNLSWSDARDERISPTASGTERNILVLLAPGDE